MLMMENYLTGPEDVLFDYLTCYDSMDTFDPPGFYENFSQSPSGSNEETDMDNLDLESSLLNYGSPLHTTEEKSHRQSTGLKPVKKALQRQAANMRERRRMKSINDAFDKLRTCFPPTMSTERRLSKVDTLRLAIQYIDQLGNLVRSCNDYGTDKKLRKSPRHQEKILMRCHMTTQSDDLFDDTWPETVLVCHSLSWSVDNAPKISPDNRYTARTWHPEAPNQSDLINLSSYGNWEQNKSLPNPQLHDD